MEHYLEELEQYEHKGIYIFDDAQEDIELLMMTQEFDWEESYG